MNTHKHTRGGGLTCGGALSEQDCKEQSIIHGIFFGNPCTGSEVARDLHARWLRLQSVEEWRAYRQAWVRRWLSKVLGEERKDALYSQESRRLLQQAGLFWHDEKGEMDKEYIRTQAFCQQEPY